MVFAAMVLLDQITFSDATTEVIATKMPRKTLKVISEGDHCRLDIILLLFIYF